MSDMPLRYSMQRMSVKLGRPRDVTLDREIAAATERLLLEARLRGRHDRAGRPRGGGRRARRCIAGSAAGSRFVTAAMVDRYGTDPAPDTGTLRGRPSSSFSGGSGCSSRNPAVAAAISGVLGDIRGRS